MTHEELLARINEGIHCWQTDIDEGTACRECQSNLALIAVVELHKPQGNFGDTYIDGKPMHPYCPECIDPDVYPCPTIQAIEKALV